MASETENYSLDFLKKASLATSSDYEFVCFFDPDRIDVASLRAFVTQTQKLLPLEFVRRPEALDLSEWREFSAEELESSNTIYSDVVNVVPDQLQMYFGDLSNDDSNIRVWISDIGLIELGASGVYFYSGNVSEDRRRIKNIVELVFLAKDHFGDGMGDFGLEGVIGSQVRAVSELMES